ncbi:MAG: hypothetical protein IIU33_07745, partial [Bacteroidales bacterium]|nr:hypothetical protein [Bacteroidales bacterium]
KGDGHVHIPVSETVIEEGDLLLVVMSQQDEEMFDAVLGPHRSAQSSTSSGRESSSCTRC